MKRAILYHASLAPSGHNTQPWRVRIQRPDIWIVEANAKCRLPAVDPGNHTLMLSLGAFIENLSVAAGAMGVGVHTDVLTQDRHATDVARLTLYKDKPTRYPLQRLIDRRTVKHGFLPKEITAADLNGLSGRIGGHLFYYPRGSKHAACIQEAAVENFRIQANRDDAQQELVKWLRLSHKDARRYRDGLTTEGLEISGFKGWFMRQFVRPEAFMKQTYRNQGVDLMADLAGQGGGWIIVTGNGYGVGDMIEAGRSFERIALLARERGIGIHPMTQTLEEKNGMSQIADNHRSSIFPHFVLRVGYIEKYPEPVSLRRPIDSFVYTQ